MSCKRNGISDQIKANLGKRCNTRTHAADLKVGKLKLQAFASEPCRNRLLITYNCVSIDGLDTLTTES